MHSPCGRETIASFPGLPVDHISSLRSPNGESLLPSPQKYREVEPWKMMSLGEGVGHRGASKLTEEAVGVPFSSPSGHAVEWPEASIISWIMARSSVGERGEGVARKGRGGREGVARKQVLSLTVCITVSRPLTLYQPMTHNIICVMSSHKPIRIYMGGLILGVNTLYRLFPTVGKGLTFEH